MLQPRYHFPEPDTADCLELFAGQANISSAFAQRRRGVLQPRDLRFNHDLKQPEMQEEIINEIWEHRPKMVWLAPPCTLWCNFSRLNYEPQQLRRLRAKEQRLLTFVNRVFEIQSRLGGLAVIENPRNSDLWRADPIAKLTENPMAAYADLDLCQFGMTSVVDGMPLRKPLALLTNDAGFAKALSKKCPEDHLHRPIQGKDTAASAEYPIGFARAVVKAFDNYHKQRRGETQFPTTTVPGPDPAEKEMRRGAEAIYFKGKVKPVVAAMLRRIHQNLGHPPQRELIRHLRVGGASEAVIRGAEQMVCKTCEKSTRAKLPKVAHPCVALDFNEVIAIDVIWVDTVESTGLPALNIVDIASTYQVVWPVKNTTSEELGNALVQAWMSWAGSPRQIIADLDSGFKDKFLDIMSDRAVVVRCTAGQAHWQNGVAERHGGAWKAIWDKLVEDYGIFDHEVTEAMAATVAQPQWALAKTVGVRDTDETSR